MIKPLLFEGCSALIAVVLVVADCRHLAAAAPAAEPSFTEQIATDARQLLQMDRQLRITEASAVSATGNDLVGRLSDLSELYAASPGRQAHTR